VLVGCGAIAERSWLPALARHPAVIDRLTLVDPDAERACRMAERFGVPRHTGDLASVLDGATGAIIAAPARWHHRLALECLRSGVAVLCEKPLALSKDEADEIVREAQEAGVSAGVANTRRLFPVSRRVRDLIADGGIGRPRSLRFLQGEVFDWPAASDSYFGPNAGTKGVLLDIGAHVLDLICWWLGGRPRLVDYRDDSFGGTEAMARIALELDGCAIDVQLSWLNRLANLFRIEGEEGAIEAGIFDREVLTLVDRRGRAERVRAGRTATPANELVDDFLDVLRSRRAPLIPASEVAPSIALIDECYSRRLRFDMPWHDAMERIRVG
jgi:predicted dehydrogenase